MTRTFSLSVTKNTLEHRICRNNSKLSQVDVCRARLHVFLFLSSSGAQRRVQRPGFSRKRSHPDSSRRKRSNKYEKLEFARFFETLLISVNIFRDFVEGSSESEDTTYSESSPSSSDSSVEEIRPRGKPIIRKSPVIVQTKSFSVTRVPIKKKITKRDRFYDRSRDIPNDVYFGDVKGNKNFHTT